MKKSLGASLSAVILSLAIPVLFLMMMSSALSQTTTGIMADSQGDRQSFFDLYYREPIMNTQKEKMCWCRLDGFMAQCGITTLMKYLKKK
ncbi:hypothetical protein PT034_02730 [Erysipelothrix rhusiopathiae]|nr:hypothetical protein [Erysipelothrix rhusiopathiae]MDE8186624.1 hypothetical protein [Erysipelothrix rhusiopathiae]